MGLVLEGGGIATKRNNWYSASGEEVHYIRRRHSLGTNCLIVTRCSEYLGYIALVQGLF